VRLLVEPIWGQPFGVNVPKPRVLIAEDDEATRKAYCAFLDGRGFEVLEAPNGSVALDLASRAQMVMLDVMMPGLDGWQVAERLQQDHPDKPVLMVTALGSSSQKMQGFDLGVDDYLVKPVDLHELEARLRVIMRRSGISTSIVRGPVSIHPQQRAAKVAGKTVTLSPLEFDLLHKLALHPGKVWSRAELLRAVWGGDYFGVDRTVDVRVAALRRKLGERPDGGQYIETIRSHGYRFALQGAP